MAVMIEAISVVIRTSTLKAKYPGGVWEYMSNVPNGSLCIIRSYKGRIYGIQ